MELRFPQPDVSGQAGACHTRDTEIHAASIAHIPSAAAESRHTISPKKEPVRSEKAVI